MTYMLRDLPDGQVEITISRPMVVGVMPDRDMAASFVAFLQHEEPELIEDEPAGFATAISDAADAALDLRQIVTEPPKPKCRAVSNLPAVVDKPQPPALLPVIRPALTEAQLDDAFARLGAGEKLVSVAGALGVPVAQLRGYWGHQRKLMQRHLAEAGQQPCVLCQKPFVPSMSNPDTCARCSHE